MGHREGRCWCLETHHPSALSRINGEDVKPLPPAKQITIQDPTGIHPDRAKHEIRFTTTLDEHFASSNVEYLTDAELASLLAAVAYRYQATR